MKKLLIISTLLPIMLTAYENTYEIQSTVWNDRNQNWEIDNEEKIIRNVNVALYDNTGKAIRHTETNRNGQYTFSRIKEGDYSIQVEVPKGLSAITDTKLELYVDKNTKGKNNFGLYDSTFEGDFTLGSYTQRVWYDINKNWEIDKGETSPADVTVNLYKGYDKKIATTKTIGGSYKFENLAEGEYTIKIEVPKGAIAITDTEASLYLEKSEPGISFGIFDKSKKGTLRISSYVWNDSNRNWIKDVGEKGINGVTVAIYTKDGKKIATTKTRNHLTNHYIGHHTYASRDGYYHFRGLEEGEYIIKVEPPKGFASSTTGKLELWLEELYSKNKNDFGIYNKNSNGSYTIHSYVGIDKNNNGKIDQSEKGINNIKVNIYNNQGEKVASTLTNSHKYNHMYKEGHFKFDKLEEGNYKIEIEVPKGMHSENATKYIWINKDRTHIDFAITQ